MQTAEELRTSARAERDARKRVRLWALANVRDGMPIAAAAKATGMGRSSLYRWIGREPAEGAHGLADRPRCGRPRKLTAEQRAEVKDWVLAGPGVETDGIVAWRGADGQALIERRFGVKLAVSSVYRRRDALKLSALAPRPRHLGADAGAQEAFRKALPSE